MDEFNLIIDINSNSAEKIFKALGNATRLDILRFLSTRAFSVAQISSLLDVPVSTLQQHLRVLEDAGLIKTSLRAASRGNEKVCASVYHKIEFNVVHKESEPPRSSQISMPIGSYSDFSVTAPCGLASATKIIGFMSDVSAFLEPERMDAQLLWFTDGWLEYRFPKRLPPKTIPTGLYFSAELCSEAPLHNLDWPSDITVWINGLDVGTWTSPADFGGTRGILTPEWWDTACSQYGSFKSWNVTREGSAIDGYRVSDVTINDLNIIENPYISVRIGVQPDARHKGGINLFGQKFGNFAQDLVLRLIYDFVE